MINYPFPFGTLVAYEATEMAYEGNKKIKALALTGNVELSTRKANMVDEVVFLLICVWHY